MDRDVFLFLLQMRKKYFQKTQRRLSPEKKINIKNYSVNVWQFELLMVKMEKTHASEDKCLIPSDVLQREPAPVWFTPEAGSTFLGMWSRRPC